MAYKIGIDVGGTFTDLVAVDEKGRVTHTKTASTPQDQSVGVMDGLALLAEALRADLAAMLGQTERIFHGTTVATNALLERKGSRVGLLTTEGHIDVLEMRERPLQPAHAAAGAAGAARPPPRGRRAHPRRRPR
jgi:N-methylhydantoinase A